MSSNVKRFNEPHPLHNESNSTTLYELIPNKTSVPSNESNSTTLYELIPNKTSVPSNEGNSTTLYELITSISSNESNSTIQQKSKDSQFFASELLCVQN
ncbi:4996_t:CDS:2, partial [Dentiscutata heterogama]